MDATVRMMGWLRAKGAEMVSLYNDLKATSAATETELQAAEDAMRAPGVPSAGAPETVAATTLPVDAIFLAAAKAAAAAGARVNYYTPEQEAALAAAKPQQLGWRDGGTDGSIPYHYLSDIRIDDVVPSGTPGTVTLPKTGHVLSLPSDKKTQAGTPELFFGYAQRVIQQATAGQAEKYMASLAALLIGGSTATADKASWPEAADRFFNLRAYMTPEERAAADAPWSAWTIGKP